MGVARPIPRRLGLVRPRGAMLVCAACLAFAPSLVAQDTGGVRGTVRSASDSLPIPQATVLLVGTPLGVVSDGGGGFRLGRIARGVYTIRVVAAGYETAAERDVRVSAGETSELTIFLERSVVEVPGIVVTASRSRTGLGEAPVSVAVLGSDEIERRNVNSLEEALPFAQGVMYNSDQLDIRGASGLSRGVGSRVLVLLDGHRLLTGAGSEADFETFPLLDVDRVEVVKGPHSSLYGSSALGGVVNVITARPAERPETVARLFYGVYDTPSRFRFTDESLTTRGLGIQHSRRFGSVGATLFFAGEGSDGFRQNGSYSRWQARAKTVFAADSDRPVDAFVNWTRRDSDEFFTWLSEDRPLEVDPAEEGDWLREEDLAIGLTARPVASQSLLLQVRPLFAHNSVQNHFHDNEDYHRTSRLSLDTQLSLNPWARHGVSTGVELSGTSVRSDFLGDPTAADVAVYAQDEILLADRWRGTAGVRLDYHKAESAERDLVPSPKVGFVYLPSPGLSLRASVSRGYRAPSVSEQYTATTQFGFKVIPNLELRGETAWAAEVGGTASVGGWLLFDGALFYSDYDDLIAPALVPGGFFEVQFQNVAAARVSGLDAGLQIGVLGEMLDLKTNYVFLDTEDKRTGKALPYRSTHNVTVTLETLRRAVGVDFRYRSRVEEVLAYPLDPRDPITVVDVRFAYRLGGVTLMAKVSNLFQSHYVNVQERNPGATRHFQLTVMPRL